MDAPRVAKLLAVLLAALGAFAENDLRDGSTGGPPWFGAKPTRGAGLQMHRRGWDACLLCGGSERLGAVVDVGDVRRLEATGAATILDAVRAHGVVVLKNQNLTRGEQVALTAALGEVVVLPKSFEGQDPEPLHPAIQRVTNFWANGTWKGATSKFGAYWHQDGQFWIAPRHNLLSVLHAQQTPPSGGEVMTHQYNVYNCVIYHSETCATSIVARPSEKTHRSVVCLAHLHAARKTGFADLRAASATLSAPLRARATQASIVASVRDIADFAKGDEADLAAFPNARHPLLAEHLVDGGPLLYVGSPHMAVEGLETPAAGKALLGMLLAHATSPAFTYFHAWDAGDIIIWDNTQTLHHSMPYTNDGEARRELYRTQARLTPTSTTSEL